MRFEKQKDVCKCSPESPRVDHEQGLEVSGERIPRLKSGTACVI